MNGQFPTAAKYLLSVEIANFLIFDPGGRVNFFSTSELLMLKKVMTESWVKVISASPSGAKVAEQYPNRLEWKVLNFIRLLLNYQKFTDRF